ncbi:Uncharacterised protein [Candidatus Tiddalikarchaeum anstoanum]|nr:Uncharacterised protein [Candidatus Tiddalikarchaeum anstoanum]
MRETRYGLDVYFGDGINSNVIIDPVNKIYFDASGVMPKIDEAYTGYLTHDHPDHVWIKNLKGILYLPENNNSLNNPDMNARINHAENMFKDDLGIYPGILGTKAFLYTNYAIALVDYVIHKKQYTNLQIKTFRNEQTINDITCYILGGHSADTTIYILERDDKRIGITGDTLYRNSASNSYKTRDADLNNSILADMKIATLGLDVIMPGHGPVIEGKDKIKEMYTNSMNWEINEEQVMLNLTKKEGGTNIKEIKKLRGYEGRSDMGYGRPFAFAKQALKQGLIIIEKKQLIYNYLK